MTTVTIPIALGGTGTAYNDGGGPFGMTSRGGYGYATYLMPMISEVMAACQTAVNATGSLDAVAAAATLAQTTATERAAAASTSAAAAANSEAQAAAIVLGNFLQSGTGAGSRTYSAKAREVVSVTDYYANGVSGALVDPTGVTDSTAGIQAAATYAAGAGKALYIPAGTYIVSSTVTFPNSLRVFGDGINKTIIRPTISNGSVCLQFGSTAGQGFLRPENFSVRSNINSANFIAGTINAQNCTGIALGTASVYCTRWHLSTVGVYGCKTGWYVRGFIGTADDMWAEYCELGFDGYELNATDLNLKFENNRKDFSILKGDAVLLRQLLQEGDANNPIASTIDDCNGVELLQPYWEGGSSTGGGRAVPWVTFGGTTQVSELKITGGKCVAAGQFAYGTHPIKLDRVDGADVDVYFSTGDRIGSVETTANTKNYRNNSRQSAFAWLHDSSKQLGPAFNYWPNRAFDVWLRGFAVVSPLRATVTQETTIVRKGRNALRLSATAGQINNNFEMRLTGPTVTYLRGKTIRFGAWIWVPAITEYLESARTAFASIMAQSYNGSVTLNSTTQNNYAKRGEWNFFWAELTVQTDATQLSFFTYANQSSNAATGNEFVVVDSILLTEATTPMRRMVNDDLIDSPLINATFSGGRMTLRSDSVPTDANQTFEVGDEVRKITYAAGASPGWGCTTGGVGGVAVFKAMAALAA